MLLPITFGLPPVSALIMLAGIYYGSQDIYSTTAILVNLPGEVVLLSLRRWTDTRWPGKDTPKPSRDELAIGSFFAPSVATVLIALFAPPLAQVGA